VGTSATITATVMTNGQVDHNINAVFSSSLILVNINQSTGAITVIGLSPGTAQITLHPTDLPNSNTSQDSTITVNVTAPATLTSAQAAALTTTTATGTGTTVTSNTGTGTGNVVNSDQQLIQQLSSQVADLQNRLNSLNAQLANQGGSSGTNTVVVQSGDTSALQNQITGLQAQVGQLSSLVSQLQSGQVHILGSVDQVQSLQMPASTSQGALQMPAGYPASGGTDSSSQAASQSQGQAIGTYTVKKGDSLWNIAKKYYGDGTKWRKILSANPNCLSIPGNVKTLKIGAVLTIPRL